MFIQNVSLTDIKIGMHKEPGENAILIQIADPAGFFPAPMCTFKEVYQFEFIDAEDCDDYPEEVKISDQQANKIVEILKNALENEMNVIVHCMAGICRSGAVAEVGVMIGFETTNRYRQPNLMVKHKLMRALGLTYDSSEVPYGVRGTFNHDDPFYFEGKLW